MKNPKIIFMGTPLFACEILKSILASGYQVDLVVSQPDKKVGRKQEVVPTPVKQLALEHNISVFQPISIKTDYQTILDVKPDLIITCAYGQILPKAVLEAPSIECINVHASLLPKYRGGAPIHKAIINGEKESGVSIMRMVEKMDAGAYMLQGSTPITNTDTVGTLHDKLAALGAELITSAIPLLLNGEAQFTEQDETQVTYGWNVSKEEEKIDLSKPVVEVYNQVRGLIPWPVGYVMLEDKKLKLWEVSLVEDENSNNSKELLYRNNEIYISLNGGYLKVSKLQLEGKKQVSDKEFINGVGQKYAKVVLA